MNRRFAILIMIFSFAIAARAQAFSVSPIGYKSTITPGEKQNFNVVVTNNEVGVKNYQVEINSMRSTEDGKRYYEKNYDNAEGWATINPTSFSLLPGASKTVSIVVAVPVGSNPGSHALAFMVSSANIGGGQIGLSAKSAVPLSLIVAGQVTERLAIKNFALKNNLTSKNIWPFSISLYNEGTVDVQAIGYLEIKNMFGNKVVGEPILFGNAIYPQSARNLVHPVSLTGLVWPGRYSARLLVQYGSAKINLISEASVWYFPVWFLVLISIVLIILIIWVWKKRTGHQ